MVAPYDRIENLISVFPYSFTVRYNPGHCLQNSESDSCGDSVIDKWNFMWIGCGGFMYDGSTYSVLRIDTNNGNNPMRVFMMTHETKVCNGFCLTNFCLYR